MTAQAWIAAAIGIAAIVDDVSRRQVSNWIPCSAFVAGVALQSWQAGWRGAGSALLGTLMGAAVFFIFYWLGGMGGGDVKLMAGFGAVLGVKQLLEASLWTAGCGGFMAVGALAYRHLKQIWLKWRGRGTPAGQSQPGSEAESIPYAPAIAAGVWLSLVPKT